MRPIKLFDVVNWLNAIGCRFMKYVFCFFIGLILLFPLSNAFSQENNSEHQNIQNYKSIKFTLVENELSGQWISTIKEDINGFMWIGTQDGLYRFDGNNTISYRYNPLNKHSIPTNWIRSIAQQKNELFWLGTHGAGLVAFDAKKNTFPDVYTRENQGFKGVIIPRVFITSNDVFWVDSEEGLYRKGNALSEYKKMGNSYLNTRIIETTNGKELIAQDSALYVYNVKEKRLKPLLNNTVIEQLSITSNNDVIYKSKGKIYKYNLKNNNTEILLPEPIRFMSNIQNNKCFFISNQYIFKYNFNTNTVERYLNTNQDLQINTIYLDFNEILWIGSRTGLYKQNNNAIVFNTTIPIHARRILASNDTLHCIGEDGYRTYNSNFKQIHHQLKNIRLLSIKKSKNSVWLGSYNGILYKVNKNNQIKTIPLIKDRENYPRVHIYGIEEDKRNRIWVSSWVGIHVFNKNGVLIKTFKPDTNTKNRELKTVKTHLDKQRNLWVTTVGNGIYKILDIDNISTDDSSFKYERYMHQQGNTNTINTNVLYEIHEDKTGNLWFGSDYGINIYNHNTNNFSALIKDGVLFDKKTMAIESDNQGFFWISTANDGIFIYNPKDNSFLNLNETDGLISNACLYTSSEFANTKLFFGTDNGIQIINPSVFKFPEIESSPLITKLSLLNEEEIVPETQTLNNQEINLKHNQNDFSINFSLLDYRFPTKLNYYYKLDGFDENWKKANGNKANFSNLSPGNYTFLIKAAYQSQALKNVTASSMKINISSPWYKTWYAYLLYAATFLFLSVLLYRFNLNRKLAIAEKNKTLELDNLKSKMYANISHEFRTPLTVIKGMTDYIKSNVENKQYEDLENSLEMIDRNSDSLLHLVNEMLDLAKIESGNMKLQLVQDDVIPFLKYLSESFSSLAEENQINLTIYAEIDTLIMDFDTNKLISIISNLLSNAVKFTPELGKIIVHINQIRQKENTYLFVKIKDSGIGISPKELPNIFNRFYQTDTSTIRKNEGTGIGLALTKELVELMKGTIEVRSTLDKGSEFRIMIPVTRLAPTSKNVQIVKVPHTSVSNILPVGNTQILETNSELPLVLIIEDNMDVAYYLKTCLLNKYETVHAVNGIVGIEMAIEKIPDIIICDVMMPEKDGFEVCATLKSDERTDHIPIIILTAKVTTEDRLTGLSLGADAYLAKPFNKEELFTRLNQLVLLRKKLIGKIQKDDYELLQNKRDKNPKIKFLQKVVKLIQGEIGNATFGSSELAKKLLISESQMYRKIKAISGKSTAIFIRSIRLQYAKKLLQNTDKTVSEVAYDVGFNDPSWFSRAFKDEFGFAPSSTSK